MDHYCCLLIRCWEIEHNANNNINGPPVFFPKVCLCNKHLFRVVERGVDDASQVAVNKITAHTCLFILLIHHLLPESSCHALSVFAAETSCLRETLGKWKTKNTPVIGFWLANALQWRWPSTMCGGFKCLPGARGGCGSHWLRRAELAWMAFSATSHGRTR